MRGAIWSLVSDVMFPIFWIIPMASILREYTDIGRSLEPVVGNDGSSEAKSPGRRRRSSHALAPQHRATVTSVRGHPRGGRRNGSRTGEVGGAGDRDSGSPAARARWGGGSERSHGERAGAPRSHPHKVWRRAVSGRGVAALSMRLTGKLL